MSKTTKERNPFQPLRGIAEVLSVLFWLALIVAVWVNLHAVGWLPGVTPGPLCVDADGYVPAHITGDLGVPVKAGVEAHARIGSLCVEQPSGGQRFADIGAKLPPAVFLVGTMILLLHFLKTAARQGPYSDAIPGKLRLFGWYVLLGGPVSALLAALAQYSLRQSMVGELPTSSWLSGWMEFMPWWAVVTGAAALSFARVLRIGSRMREDLEGTV
ncbi:hypothetical protein [Amycolatopsis samaneae]|uniref:DUF2975 domain-containing protein n=1 Tax=Amycolatopsis samaneae TaxID=664691 RepID=A0ABW5GAP3_9PSEU